MDRPTLRKLAADQGITETGRYMEWLEERVIELEELYAREFGKPPQPSKDS